MACKHWQEGPTDAPPAAFSSDGLCWLVARRTRRVGLDLEANPQLNCYRWCWQVPQPPKPEFFASKRRAQSGATHRGPLGVVFTFFNTLQSHSAVVLYVYLLPKSTIRSACTKPQQLFFCACCRDTSTREWQSFQLFARSFR
jgi:hypothetical protein